MMNIPILNLTSLNQFDTNRRTMQQLRWRLLNQDYGDDASGEGWVRPNIDAFLGPERAALIPAVDFSNNALLTAAMQLSTPGLYNRAPQVSHADDNGMELAEIMCESGYWLHMQRVQFLTVGMGDAFLHISALDGKPSFREVPPHHVVVDVAPEDPSRVVRFRELRLRDCSSLGIGMGLRWCWDVYDLSDASFKIVSADNDGLLLTNLIGLPAEGVSGDLYPWKYADGSAYIPYVHYATQVSGAFWHHNETRGLTRATLSQMAFQTAANQSAFDSSHSTAIIAGCHSPGAPVNSTAGDGSGGIPASRMALLPGSALFLETIDQQQPLVAQLRPSADLAQLRLWMAGQEAALLTRMGLAADDVQFMAANPTSAGSLAIRNRAKTMVSGRIEPYFRMADQTALKMVAALLGYPETGYSISYQQISLAPEDEKTTLEAEKLELDMGLTSRVILYQNHHPGTSREDAIRALQQIDADEADLGEDTEESLIATPTTTPLE